MNKARWYLTAAAGVSLFAAASVHADPKQYGQNEVNPFLRNTVGEKFVIDVTVGVKTSDTTVSASQILISPVKGWITGLRTVNTGGTTAGSSPSIIQPVVSGTMLGISNSIVSGTAHGTVVSQTIAPSATLAVDIGQAIEISVTKPSNATQAQTAGDKARVQLEITPNYR